MPLRPMLPAVLFAFAMSILIGVLSVTRGASVPLGIAAGLFSLQVLVTLWRINAPLWSSDAAHGTGADWAWSNTVLAAIVYAWGAAAMFTIYSLTGLHWRHWWQYGAGMALLAAAALLCATYLASGRGRYGRATSLNILMSIAAAQAVSVVGALVYLVATGKLDTPKSDWAANHIFIAGCVTIGIISIVSLLAHRRCAAALPVSA
jgi:hypothetical protein